MQNVTSTMACKEQNVCKLIQIATILFVVALSACAPGDDRIELTRQQLLTPTATPAIPAPNNAFLPAPNGVSEMVRCFSSNLILESWGM